MERVVRKHYCALHTCVERWQETVDPLRSPYTYEEVHLPAEEAPAAELKMEGHREGGHLEVEDSREEEELHVELEGRRGKRGRARVGVVPC